MDITACNGIDCPIKLTCVRYLFTQNNPETTELTPFFLRSPYSTFNETCSYYMEERYKTPQIPSTKIKNQIGIVNVNYHNLKRDISFSMSKDRFQKLSCMPTPERTTNRFKLDGIPDNENLYDDEELSDDEINLF